MPKILTAGMIWTVYRKNILTQQSGQNGKSGYYSSAPATDMNSTRTSEQYLIHYFYSTPKKQGDKLL